MSLEEAKSQISEIVEACKDFQSSVNSLQSDLLSFADDVNSTLSSISSDINEPNIVSHCSSSANNIISTINSTLGSTNDALAVLSKDATNKIKEIVDSYNAYNNSLEEDKRGESLSYVEVSLTGVAGAASLGSYSASGTSGFNATLIPVEETGTEEIDNPDVDTSESSDDNSNNRPSYSGGSYDYSPSDDTPVTDTPQTFDIDYYFGLLGTSGIDSADIPNWDTEIKNFLQENNLDSYITKIELKDKKIKITLSNGKEVELEDVTTKDKFLEKIEEILKQEGLKE